MHTLQDIRRSLDDLIESARFDIHPIIQLNNPQGGYFGVPRSVLSYIDYLGALYCGYAGVRRGTIRQIATSQKAEQFIEDVLGNIDIAYRNNGKLLYRMYRHGTVHLYRPNILKRNDNRIIIWVSYKGNRVDRIPYDNRVIDAQHVVPQNWSATEDILPVSINCLYNDLVDAIGRYYDMVEDEVNRGITRLQANYSNVVDALLLPDDTNLTWRT